jgi:hypothetical protein
MMLFIGEQRSTPPYDKLRRQYLEENNHRLSRNPLSDLRRPEAAQSSQLTFVSQMTSSRQLNRQNSASH